MNTKLTQFKNNYQDLNKDTLHLIDEMYDSNIIFKDPLHHIQGVNQLKTYFEHMYENVNAIHFSFTDEFIKEEQAVLLWQMTYQHKRIKGGQAVKVNGSSHLRFKEKCYYHRDYFDAGELLYEHLPILRGFIRAIKKRVN